MQPPLTAAAVTCDDEIYHERQRLALCGVHAVNNLLQKERFRKSDFDETCQKLSPRIIFNPHRSIFGIGDYDVNVVTMLLQEEGLTVSWHDRRTLLELKDLEDDPQMVGVLWNVQSTSLWGRIMRGRHWIALLLRRGGQWINLDSTLSEPQVIGSHDACLQLLKSEADAHILFVKHSTLVETSG
jgi:hypothetical protein